MTFNYPNHPHFLHFALPFMDDCAKADKPFVSWFGAQTLVSPWRHVFDTSYDVVPRNDVPFGVQLLPLTFSG